MLSMNLREAMRSLMSSKQRTFLALLGIVIGVASVIAMVSVGTIVQREALRQFVELGTDILRITDLTESRSTPGRTFGMQAAKAMRKASPDIGAMAPYTTSYGYVKYRAVQWSMPVIGCTAEMAGICKLRLSRGRHLTALDGGMLNCVIGEKLTSELSKLGVNDPIGKEILVLGNLCTIVGMLERVPMSDMRPIEVNDGLLVSYSTLAAISGKDQVTNIIARLRVDGDTTRAQMQVRGFASKTFPSIHPVVRSAEEVIAQMNRQMNMMTLLLGVIGSISLIVGGVGVMNVMLVSVTERRREIGVRRAIGAQQRDIQWQFLLEAMLLCTIGGVIGIGFGVGSSWLIARYSEWEFLVSWMAVLLGGGVSIMVGVFFGFYPAIQASRLNPIDALRAT